MTRMKSHPPLVGHQSLSRRVRPALVRAANVLLMAPALHPCLGQRCAHASRGGVFAVLLLSFLVMVNACGAASSDESTLPAQTASRSQSAEDDLFALLNEARAASGKPPLERSEALDRVARLHSTDMRQKRYRSHIAPDGSTPNDRAERANIRSGLVLENIGEGPAMRDIHQGFVDSPSHRANLLNADVTHVGVGVVPADPRGETWVVTQVFVTMTSDVDVAEAPAEVLRKLNALRRDRGLQALETEPNLQQAAANGARDFFAKRSMSQQEVVEEASASLRRFTIAFARVGGVMAVVDKLDEAVQLEPALQPGLRYVGVGVAQGSRADTPANAIAVVIMFAWAR